MDGSKKISTSENVKKKFYRKLTNLSVTTTQERLDEWANKNCLGAPTMLLMSIGFNVTTASNATQKLFGGLVSDYVIIKL